MTFLSEYVSIYFKSFYSLQVVSSKGCCCCCFSFWFLFFVFLLETFLLYLVITGICMWWRVRAYWSMRVLSRCKGPVNTALATGPLGRLPVVQSEDIFWLRLLPGQII